MKPVFAEMEKEFEGKVAFESIDVEANGALAGQYQVMSIPTFVILKDDKEVARTMGAMPKDAFKTWLEENI
jgi:thioredoxin 1